MTFSENKRRNNKVKRGFVSIGVANFVKLNYIMTLSINFYKYSEHYKEKEFNCIFLMKKLYKCPRSVLTLI